MGFYGGCISFLSRHPDCLAQQVFARAPVGSKLEASALQALRAAGVKEAWMHMAKPAAFDPCKLVIDCHRGGVRGVQFSPDGSKVLVSIGHATATARSYHHLRSHTRTHTSPPPLPTHSRAQKTRRSASRMLSRARNSPKWKAILTKYASSPPPAPSHCPLLDVARISEVAAETSPIHHPSPTTLNQSQHHNLYHPALIRSTAPAPALLSPPPSPGGPGFGSEARYVIML